MPLGNKSYFYRLPWIYQYWINLECPKFKKKKLSNNYDHNHKSQTARLRDNKQGMVLMIFNPTEPLTKQKESELKTRFTHYLFPWVFFLRHHLGSWPISLSAAMTWGCMWYFPTSVGLKINNFENLQLSTWHSTRTSPTPKSQICFLFHCAVPHLSFQEKNITKTREFGSEDI